MVRIEGFGRPGQFRRAVADPIEMWSSRRSQLGNQRMLLIKYETYAIGWRNQVKDRSEKEGGEGRGRVEDERVKRVGSAARLSVLLRLLVCLALRGCEVARLRGCEAASVGLTRCVSLRRSAAVTRLCLIFRAQQQLPFAL